MKECSSAFLSDKSVYIQGMTHLSTSGDFTPPASNQQHSDQVFKGVLFAATAFFLLAVMNAIAKVLSEEHHVIEIAFYRNLFSFIPFLLFILGTKRLHLFKTQRPKMIAFRSVFGLICLCTTFAAFQALPMAEVTVLLFTSSLLMPALSYFILKERVGRYRWAAIAIGLCGVIIMAGPSGMMNMTGVVLALLAATMHATLGMILRSLKTESPLTVTFYFVTTGMVLSGLFMPFIATPPDTEEIPLLLGLGFTGALAQLCLASAFKNAPAAAVSPFNYTGLIWATGFDILIWQAVPGWPVFLGGFIVIGSSLFIAYRERLNEQRLKKAASAN